MQADRPFRMTEVLGSCQIGTVWSAVDVQGRPLTVAVLAPNADAHWRDAFAAAANALDQPRSGPHFLYADFSAAGPWVACPADGGPGAERVFLSLGQEYHPVPPDTGDSADEIPAPAPAIVDETTVDVAAPALIDPESTQPISPVAGPGPSTPTPHRPISPAPQPISPEPVRPVSPWATGERPTSIPPVSGPPASGPAGRPGPAISGPLPPVGGPRPPGPDPVSPSGVPADDPFTSPVRRIQPVARKRRRTRRWLLIVVVLAVLLGGAGAFAWRWTLDDRPPEDDQRTAATESAPFPTATPQEPGLEPPRPGAWPAAWPAFAPTDRIRTLTGLDGLGFTLKIPMSWQCVLDGRGAGFVRYRCGLAAGDDLQTGGELIVRDCPEQCPRERQTAMRQAEEAWGLQWITAGPTAAYAESSTLQIDGAQRYGLVVVAFWRSGSEGAIDRQVVFRMTAPVDGAGQLRRVANYLRDTVIF